MLDLFPKEKIILPLPDAVFEFYPNFCSAEEADVLFEKLLNETPWQHDEITIFGKKFFNPDSLVYLETKENHTPTLE